MEELAPSSPTEFATAWPEPRGNDRAATGSWFIPNWQDFEELIRIFHPVSGLNADASWSRTLGYPVSVRTRPETVTSSDGTRWPSPGDMGTSQLEALSKAMVRHGITRASAGLWVGDGSWWFDESRPETTMEFVLADETKLDRKRDESIEATADVYVSEGGWKSAPTYSRPMRDYKSFQIDSAQIARLRSSSVVRNYLQPSLVSCPEASFYLASDVDLTSSILACTEELGDYVMALDQIESRVIDPELMEVELAEWL